MQLIININMENDAFIDNNTLEVVKILNYYTKQISKGGTLAVDDRETLMDSNGNSVGYAKIIT
jgi:hypothetical protein